MSTPDEKKLIKYADKSPDEMAKEQDKLEQEVSVASQALDQQIQKFSSKTDEMKAPDGAVLAIVKRPTSAQFKRFTPPELAKFKDKPENITIELAEKYEKDIYKLMEELIVTPKHTAEEWPELVGDDFIAVFQAHLFNVRKKMAETVQSFL